MNSQQSMFGESAEAMASPVLPEHMITFFAPGIPATKGSVRAFVVPGTNRAAVKNDSATAKAWASLISTLAMEAMAGRAPLADVAVRVSIVFVFPRPKSHFRGKSGSLRADAPTWKRSKPDADKCERCALDALTGIVFVDDAQIANLSSKKRYGDQPGAHFEITPLVEER